MRVLKVSLIFIISICFLGCPFDENREVEKKLTNSVNEFHTLLNQNKFKEIYSKADNELKNNFTETEFTSYLKSIKENDDEEVKEISHIWLEDNLKDGIKRILIKKTRFSHVELVATEKAIYREKFNWNLSDEEAKLVSFKRETICNKPCQLDIKTK